jgi:hypothetical protein
MGCAGLRLLPSEGRSGRWIAPPGCSNDSWRPPTEPTKRLIRRHASPPISTRFPEASNQGMHLGRRWR